jgi:hypothetical protein
MSTMRSLRESATVSNIGQIGLLIPNITKEQPRFTVNRITHFVQFEMNPMREHI